ncbi:MAG TPA: RNA polymerase sigma-70 factor [Chryseosolibacter sp.]
MSGELNSDLILRIKQGDARSFEVLFNMLYGPLCSYANKFVHDADEAEEIAQDVFIRLWNARTQLDEDDSVKGYLFTAAKNKCLHYLEHKKVKDKYAAILHHVYTAIDDQNAYEHLVANELEAEIRKALQGLPKQCRAVFQLNRQQGLKYSEIATRLNISQKTVETQMSRALSKLRVQLRDYMLTLFWITSLIF